MIYEHDREIHGTQSFVSPGGVCALLYTIVKTWCEQACTEGFKESSMIRVTTAQAEIASRTMLIRTSCLG